MTLDFRRGAKLAARSAICFAIMIPLNQWLRSEPVDGSATIVGAVFAFCVFGIIGTLTDKIGSDFGES